MGIGNNLRLLDQLTFLVGLFASEMIVCISYSSFQAIQIFQVVHELHLFLRCRDAEQHSYFDGSFFNPYLMFILLG